MFSRWDFFVVWLRSIKSMINCFARVAHKHEPHWFWICVLILSRLKRIMIDLSNLSDNIDNRSKRNMNYSISGNVKHIICLTVADGSTIYYNIEENIWNYDYNVNQCKNWFFNIVVVFVVFTNQSNNDCSHHHHHHNAIILYK